MNGKKETTLVIEAGKGRRQFFRDLWNYRELFLFLSWRDILVRYKQAVLGVLWSILRPLLTIAVFSLVFGRLAKLPAQGVPYPVLVSRPCCPGSYLPAPCRRAATACWGTPT
jgi:lipopolysaccharide transport system permease protein